MNRSIWEPVMTGKENTMMCLGGILLCRLVLGPTIQFVIFNFCFKVLVHLCLSQS